MTWLLAYSGLPLKDCTWCWAELCKIYSLRHLLTPSRTLTFPRLHPGNWVRRCFIAYIYNKNISYSVQNDDPFASVCAGIKLTGGIGSKWQGIYVEEVVPSSPACEEGSIQPNDKIVYICGKCTLGMTLEDAVKVCESAPRKVRFKAMRLGWRIIRFKH